MEIVLESTDHEVFMSLDLTRARGNSFSDFPIIAHEEEDESIPEPLRAIFDITDFSNYEVEAEKLKSKIEQAEIDNEREHDLLALLEDMHMGNAVNIAKLKSRIDNLTAAHNEGNKLKHSIATGTMPIFIKQSEDYLERSVTDIADKNKELLDLSSQLSTLEAKRQVMIENQRKLHESYSVLQAEHKQLKHRIEHPEDAQHSKFSLFGFL